MAGEPIGEAYVRLRAAIDGNFEKEAHDSVVPAVGRIAGDAALAFAAKKIFDFGKGGIEELKDQQAAQAQLTAVIQSTGGAAGVTADHVEQLSQAGLKLSGTDDELIKKADTLLLGFTNIRNTDTDKVFDRASTAALNLSTRMGGDVTGAAQLLGRALQDPEAGMGRLQRVIGPLSDAQKESIKTFQAHGDIVSAQGVLLDALDAKVGGAAAAFGDTLPGKVAIAQESLKNAKAELVGGMAPALELGATVTAKFADVMQDLPGPVQQVGGAVVLLGGGFLALARPVNDVLNLLGRYQRTAKDTSDAVESVTAAEEAANVVQAESATVQESSTVASEQLTVAQAQRIVSNDALKFSDAQVAAAVQAREAAEALALVSNDALIAGDEELAAADGALIEANAALIASDAELAAAQDGLAGASEIAGLGIGATLGPIGLAVAAVGVLGAALAVTGGGESDTAKATDDYTKALESNSGALQENIDKVTADKLEHDDIAAKADKAGVGYTYMFDVIRKGNPALDQLRTALANTSAGYDNNAQQLAAMHRAIDGTQAATDPFVRSLLKAADAGQLQAEDIRVLLSHLGNLETGYNNASNAAEHHKDLQNAATGAIQGTGSAADSTAGSLDGMAGVSLDAATQQAKDLADKYQRVQQEADAAFAAQLRLAPADIRVQQGGLTIADDQSRLADAQQKLNDAQKGGYGPAIIQAQRDLQSAQLSLTQAVNDQATALADQKKAQDDANGVTETAKQQTDNYLTALETLNAGITGPTHDAIGVYIYDIAVAKNKTDELRTSQLGLFSMQQLIDPNYYGGANDSPTQTGGRIVARAGGGRVGPGPFQGAELGRELLLLDHPGVYNSPGSGTVLPHDLTEQLMGGGGGLNIGQVNVVAMPGEPAASSVPRALAALAFENGYG